MRLTARIKILTRAAGCFPPRVIAAQTEMDDDDIAFKKKQLEEKKAAQAYLEKGKKK